MPLDEYKKKHKGETPPNEDIDKPRNKEFYRDVLKVVYHLENYEKDIFK